MPYNGMVTRGTVIQGESTMLDLATGDSYTFPETALSSDLTVFDAGAGNRDGSNKSHHYEKRVVRQYYNGAQITVPDQRIYSGDIGRFFDYTYPSLDESFRQRVLNECTLKFYSALRASNLNLSTDLAEMGKTASMIKKRCGTALTLAEGFYLICRGRFLKKYGRQPGDRIRRYSNRELYPEWSKTIANTWLEYKYGWKPFIQSTYALANHFKNKAEKPNIKVRVSRRQRTALKRNADYAAFDYLDNHESVRVQMIARVRMNSLGLNALSGITTLNPAAIAWELIPYSFVIDWFYSIGGYLEALDTQAFSGYEFLQGSTSYTHRGDLTGKLKLFSDIPAYGAVVTRSGEIRSRITEKKRIITTSFPNVPAPSFKFDLDMSQIMSGFSLLRQKFSTVPTFY